ncbi:MAG: 16S rRNA (uracil(1498)-N(3))-methyltransferase [Bacteroidales bacterium]|jgi:16S rRNA (uracil1498-N3)-methyltransferase|nr:16S rRNA (uracil(1498)-N(3))-methyltransferase [Bacteroidales bacterium]
MHLFYTPEIKNNEFYQLNEDESKHAVRVLRLNIDDEVWLTDGKGTMIQAKVLENHPKRCNLQIVKRITDYGKRNYHLHLAVAPTKNISRFEWFLEKATEIGVDEITPILCEHSERDTIKTGRLNKVITAAVKQSLKAYHPKLNSIKKFSEFIKEQKKSKMLLAWCNATEDERIETFAKSNEDILIFIGPEGGFSDNEIEEAKLANIKLVSISTSRLRTETAAIVASCSLAFINKS